MDLWETASNHRAIGHPDTLLAALRPCGRRRHHSAGCSDRADTLARLRNLKAIHPIAHGASELNSAWLPESSGIAMPSSCYRRSFRGRRAAPLMELRNGPGSAPDSSMPDLSVPWKADELLTPHHGRSPPSD
jgi:hypothetical protein